jgi:predicted DNA binding CopG/RHH family protein
VQAIGEKERRFMNKKIKYSKGEIEEVEVVNDFLPTPKDLVLQNDSVKVTISLSKDSVNFFKFQASKYHTPYQRMIKVLLDEYVNHYKSEHKGRKKA